MKKFFLQNKQYHDFYTADFELYYISVVEDEDSIHPRCLHTHEDLVEVILILNGQVKYLIEDKEYDLKKGDLVFIDSGVLHDETIIPNSGFKSYCIAFKKKQHSYNKQDTLLPEKPNPIISTKENFLELKNLFEILLDSIQNPSKISYLKANELAYNITTFIFYTLINNKTYTWANHNTKPKDIVTVAKAFIDTHFTEDLTLSKIAHSVNSSQYYIAHLFKNELGISPIQYIIRRRMGEAQTLLLTTDKNISYIASSVGYDSIHQFNILFKRKIGLSPSAYRKEYLDLAQ